jgi:putative tryptophan/tyrosine transport system substrate-binding protein
MRRRDFITLFGRAAAAWPLTVNAQQTGRMRRIGVLFGIGEGDPQAVTELAVFTKGLQELGWTEGRSIRIDTRWPGLTSIAWTPWPKN